jgi:hypothetical protein
MRIIVVTVVTAVAAVTVVVVVFVVKQLFTYESVICSSFPLKSDFF